jgi:DnaK suppressor protein
MNDPKQKTSVSSYQEIPASDILTKDELLKFKTVLNQERNKILSNSKSTVKKGSIKIDTNEMMDEVDLASATMEQSLTFRLLDRERKLLNEINHALNKIYTGDYGYCEGSGEVIPKRRLELTPWTRHSVAHKEHLERTKKTGRGLSEEDDLLSR